jgi:lipopolysaccharide export system permease protein
MMQYTLLAKDKDSNARCGVLKTAHGEIHTPIFMPVGTVGSVKAVHAHELKEDIQAEIILGNTYHLYLRPGVEVLNAASASFDEESGRWTAPRYVIYTRTEDGSLGYEQFRNLDTLINLDARELVDTKGLVKTLTLEELNDFYAQQREKGSDDLFLIEVERHTRFSYPFSTFILTLIGVSIASRKVRGGMGMHIGLGITLCFGYIMLGRVFEQVALGGSMPPWLGVWLPNIIFAVIALFVYIKAPK